MQHFIHGKIENYICERITVNLALKNNHNNPDNENEEVEIEDEWE